MSIETIMMVLLWIGGFVFAGLVLGFWIWMLVDCVRRKFEDRILWVILMLFFGIPVSIVYFFAVYLKEPRVNA